MDTQIGLSAPHRRDIALGLSRLLADTYVLYLKTHAFHWNVMGPHFNSLHLMFQAQYGELGLAVDTVAERIRSLGFLAPGTYAEFLKLTSLTETEGAPVSDEMVRLLVEGHEAVARTARSVLPLAEEAHDEVTLDLLVQRLTVHEKTAWMLRSLIRAGDERVL